MDREEQIIKELFRYEQEENVLITLYQSLAEVDAVRCLPRELHTEYREHLNKLNYESQRHLGVIREMLLKYSNKL